MSPMSIKSTLCIEWRINWIISTPHRHKTVPKAPHEETEHGFSILTDTGRYQMSYPTSEKVREIHQFNSRKRGGSGNIPNAQRLGTVVRTIFCRCPMTIELMDICANASEASCQEEAFNSCWKLCLKCRTVNSSIR